MAPSILGHLNGPSTPPKSNTDKDIRRQTIRLRGAVERRRCGETATPIRLLSAALLQVPPFGKQFATILGGTTFQNRNQDRGASVQAVKRFLEHLAWLIPRISDRAGLIEFRIQISGNHNSGAVYRKPRCYLLSLMRIHHDDEISPPHHGGDKWS